MIGSLEFFFTPINLTRDPLFAPLTNKLMGLSINELQETISSPENMCRFLDIDIANSDGNCILPKLTALACHALSIKSEDVASGTTVESQGATSTNKDHRPEYMDIAWSNEKVDSLKFCLMHETTLAYNPADITYWLDDIGQMLIITYCIVSVNLDLVTGTPKVSVSPKLSSVSQHILVLCLLMALFPGRDCYNTTVEEYTLLRYSVKSEMRRIDGSSFTFDTLFKLLFRNVIRGQRILWATAI